MLVSQDNFSFRTHIQTIATLGLKYDKYDKYIEIQYFDIENFPRYDILSNEILPSTAILLVFPNTIVCSRSLGSWVGLKEAI